jgi:hypothetical protein
MGVRGIADGQATEPFVLDENICVVGLDSVVAIVLVVLGHIAARGVERMIDAALAGTTLSFVTSEVESDVWGVGVVQEIEDLGIETYASYRSYQAEIDGTSGGEPASLPIKDFNAFLIGMRVPF